LRTEPNFLGLGAVRAGTTFLYYLLKAHPDIYVPPQKRPEPHFFLKSSEYEKGCPYYLEKYFSAVNQEKVIGEISSSYLWGERVPSRIYRDFPQLKFIAVLRNPIDRAFSNYWHSKKNGWEKLTFEEALRQEDDRMAQLSPADQEIGPFAYKGRSRYGEQVERYLKYFNREQFFFVLFEEFIKDPQTQMKRIFDFLNVEDCPVVTEALDLNKSTPTKAEVAPQTRDRLMRTFAPSNQLLSKLTGLDLNIWDSDLQAI
jgi:hypothetical protein